MMSAPVPPFHGTPLVTGSDTLSLHGAEKLASHIESLWFDLGYDVKPSIERIVTGGKHDVYCVRSDMVGGIPVRRRAGVSAR